MIRVVLVDDHGLVRAGWKLLLERAEDIEVVGEAANGVQALERVGELAPDVVLMDIAMSVMNGIDACRAITEKHPGTSVVILSMHGEARFVREAFLAGAKGYILKDSELDELPRSIRMVYSGRRYASPEIAGVLVDHVTDPVQPPHPSEGRGVRLTPRQRQVLQLVAEGRNSLEIAYELGISGKTVDAHRRKIMDTLGLHSVADLTRYAIREGITTLS
jgi:NarL family two-component system response regulator LiaR